jgi:hypothetical protein
VPLRDTRRIAVLALVILLAAACGDESQEGGDGDAPSPTETAATGAPSGTERYENPEFGFTLDYPQGWTVNDQPGVAALLVNQASAQDGFAESVNVVTEELPGEIPLDDYTEATMRNLEAGFGQIDVIEEGPTTIGGLPAHSIEYRAEQQGQTLSFFQTWLIDETTAFVLTYTGANEGFEELRPEADTIIESFRVT